MTNSPDLITRFAKQKDAFTLVEMLVVIGIIVALMSFAIPAFNSMKGGGEFDTSVSEILGMVEESRAYALANDTYVYLGFFEENGAVDSTTPATKGVGRVVVAAIARKDGLRGYSLSTALSNPAWKEADGSGYKGENFVAISRLKKFENLHLSKTMNGRSYNKNVPSSGNMLRPTLGDDLYLIGSDSCKSITPFSWPLDKPLGSGNYNFEKVIQFNPQGVARVQSVSNEDQVVYFLEISLQETRSGETPATPTDQNVGQQAAIQISGMNGAARLYRP